jgi:hypothetical protein
MEVLMRAMKRGWILVLVACVGGCLTEEDWDENQQPDPSDPCAGISCGGNGTCSGGACSCFQGYAGSRCDGCAAGYFGYPSCTRSTTNTNPCQGVSCSGHGSCATSSGKCVCHAGYTGAHCDRCASGYQGYPSCQKSCACSAGQRQCADSATLSWCEDGCNWSQLSCPSVCAPNTSSGCEFSTENNKQVCFCAPSGIDWQIYRFTDDCDDLEDTSIAFYDTSDGDKLIEGPYKLTYGKQRVFNVSCVVGHKICFGAWVSGNAWGCGANCSYSDQAVCYTCGSGSITKKPANLICS